MIVIIAGFCVPVMATFGGRIRHTTLNADIRITCFPLQEDTDRVFIGEYPHDKDIIVGFLAWQCRCFVPFNPQLEFEWQLGHSSDELSNAKSAILCGIQTQSASPNAYLIQFTNQLRYLGDREYGEGAYSEAIDFYHSSFISLHRWPGLLGVDVRDESSLLCLSRIFRALIRSNQRASRGNPFLPVLVHIVLLPANISFKKRARCLYLWARIAVACGALGTAHALGFTALMLHHDERVEGLMQQLTSPNDCLANATPPSIIRSLERKLASKDEETEECVVCLCDYGCQALLRLPCSHQFHEDCIVPWLKEFNTCPVCRSKLGQ
jgi:hypothetical protein